MNHIRHKAAMVVASGVAVASLVAPQAASASHPTRSHIPASSSAGLAAKYLVNHFGGPDNDHFTVKLGGMVYADDGETADAVMSILASGTLLKQARLATKWLKSDATNYAGTPPNVYPGSAAKLLLVANAMHAVPRNFGELDLVSAIQDSEGAGGAPAGEYQNPGDTMYGASVVNQSLAVLALANAPESDGPSTAAVDFLAGQQCGDWGFQVTIRPDTSVVCDPTLEDVDATAYAIQALLAADHHAPVSSAFAWLESVQNKNGGWGETPGAKSDANSTAIVIEALIAAHRRDAVPLRWLRKQQIECGHGARAIGAVTLTGHDYSKATALRATSEAGVALAGKSLAQVDRNDKAGIQLTPVCPVHHKKK